MIIGIDEEKEHVPILMCLSHFPWRIARARVAICKARRKIWISRTKCNGHQDIHTIKPKGDNSAICKARRKIWISRTKCSGHQDIHTTKPRRDNSFTLHKDDVLH